MLICTSYVYRHAACSCCVCAYVFGLCIRTSGLHCCYTVGTRPHFSWHEKPRPQECEKRNIRDLLKTIATKMQTLHTLYLGYSDLPNTTTTKIHPHILYLGYPDLPKTITTKIHTLHILFFGYSIRCLTAQNRNYQDTIPIYSASGSSGPFGRGHVAALRQLSWAPAPKSSESAHTRSPGRIQQIEPPSLDSNVL